MKRQKMTREGLIALAVIQCTMVEFCAAYGVNHTTLTSRLQELFDMSFTEFKKTYGAQGHTSLRRAMWTKALKGDTRLQIFLAQNCLGMVEKREEKKEMILPKYVEIEDDIAVQPRPRPKSRKDRGKSPRKAK